MSDYLIFYRLSGATFYDCINTMYQIIKPFLIIKYLFLSNMEPLINGTFVSENGIIFFAQDPEMVHKNGELNYRSYILRGHLQHRAEKN